MGRLVVAAVPIGNPKDASSRLREAIIESKVILAEDSRRFHRLCKDLDLSIEARVISFFEGNEVDRLTELRTLLGSNESILLITDAGMPGISDPGYRAIQLALQFGHQIEVIPGPSAVTAALLLSGLPTDRFAFEGFLSRNSAAREREMSDLAQDDRTLIFFEAPHRIKEFLVDAITVFGADRPGAICREMTKTYEETVRGPLSELLTWSESKEMLGEFTIVIGGFDPSKLKFDDQDIYSRVQRYESGGLSRKEAIAMTAKELSLPKRKVFDIVISNK